MAKVRYDWIHASAIIATLINVNRVKGAPVPLDAFVPPQTGEKALEKEVITDYQTKVEIGKQLRARTRRENLIN